MNLLLFIGIVAGIVAVSVCAWKFGFIGEAEDPKPILDKPVLDPKERKAFSKRLKRWKEEGKITREEFEKIYGLCSKEWDVEE